MRIGVVGINHKLADIPMRERLALACRRRFHPSLTPLHHSPVVLLSTCNRTEVYFSADDLPNMHSLILQSLREEVTEEFDQKLYSFFGHDCFIHLSRVTCGLDSAMLAETEIQGQVRNAYETTVRHHLLPPELHYLFQKTLKIGKSIRSQVFSRLSLPNLEHAIYHVGAHFFSSLKDTRILFIGASMINQKLIAFCKNRGLENLSLCNRTEENGKPLAEKYNIPLLPWEQFNSWTNYDWIIWATSASSPLVTSENLQNGLESPKLLIDLGVPRNVDPKIARLPNATLINIDQLHRQVRFRERRHKEAIDVAEAMANIQAKRQAELFFDKMDRRAATHYRKN